MSTWTELLGDEIVTKDGVKNPMNVLADKKVVGLYFSAHWCPPCRGFTPFLSAVYEDMIEKYPEFELVFVSSDQDVKAFNEYFGEMPFLAVPFENRAVDEALSKKYQVDGIPTLVFLDSKGEIITTDGRTIVAQSNGDVEKLWSELGQ